jgi:tetratricopeptide (TPR) repeat protein
MTLAEQINSIIKEADDLVAVQKFDEGLVLYRKAVSLVKEPFDEDPISTTLLTCIGDVYFLMGAYEKAARAFQAVLLCPGAPASEYIRLRRGQIAFELGNRKMAKIELIVAYMNGGYEIFVGEDPK